MAWLANRVRAVAKRRCWIGVLLLFTLLRLIPHAVAAQPALLVDIKGPIGPAVDGFVERAFEEARLRQASMIILRIDTPGGLDSSTRDIIKTILASDRPVVGYVAPSGARAASAGAYILVACHVAAMAPGTNVGSATPIQLGRLPTGDRPPGGEQEDEAEQPTLEDKVINDARAYMRGLAELRGRPVEVAERFVSQASNLTAGEAMDQGLIDLTASTVREVLVAIDGRTVTIDGEPVALDTSTIDVEPFEQEWRDRFLAFITNPNIAYLLLMIGVYGLIIEFSNPGLLVPGIVGVTALVLGLYALQLLPVNYAGLALIALGIGLMVAEALVPAFGALGIGGIVCFVLGSIMLIDVDVPGFRLSPVLVGTVSLTTAALFFIVLSLAVRAWRRPVVSGTQAMIGTTGRVVRWKAGQGHVMAHGEIWSATGAARLSVGEKVEIEGVDGLTLRVAARPSGSEEEN